MHMDQHEKLLDSHHVGMHLLLEQVGEHSRKRNIMTPFIFLSSF